MKNYADFMIILSPPDAVKALVRHHKLESAKIIGKYDGMHSIAHVSIKKLPRQKPFVTEPALINFQKKINALPPVLLTIDGFDYFTHGEEYRTIYAKIRSTSSTTLWFKELKNHLNVKEYLVPHITINKNIPVKQFNKLWPQFKASQLTEPFWVNCITFLHREAFNTFASWEIFMEMPFKGKSVPSAVVSKPTLLNHCRITSVIISRLVFFNNF